MEKSWQIAAGTFPGRAHSVVGKNNQDAFVVHQTEHCTVAVVCDGCSSGQHSEIGARLGAQLMVNYIVRMLASTPQGVAWPKVAPRLLDRVRMDVLAEMRTFANRLDASLSSTLEDYFLFTVLGVVSSSFGLSRFWLGDGIFAIDGHLHRIGPFPDNRPPYLGYGMVDAARFPFEVETFDPDHPPSSVLVGTDGLDDFIAHQDQTLPGKADVLGPLSQFWEDDRYFRNPDQVRRRLALANRDVTVPDWESHSLTKHPGLLSDDTTLIVLRRKAVETCTST